MRGAGSAQDVVELVGAEGVVKTGDANLGDYTWSKYETFAYMTNGPAMVLSSGSTRIPKYAIYPVADGFFNNHTTEICFQLTSGTFRLRNVGSMTGSEVKTMMTGVHMLYALPAANYLTFTSLFLSDSSTSDELTAMPADAIPLSEIQFADNNWSIEEAIYDAPEADANGVITPTAVTGQMRIQYSLDAAEQILTLQTEYAALEARVTALENA